MSSYILYLIVVSVSWGFMEEVEIDGKRMSWLGNLFFSMFLWPLSICGLTTELIRSSRTQAQKLEELEGCVSGNLYLMSKRQKRVAALLAAQKPRRLRLKGRRTTSKRAAR